MQKLERPINDILNNLQSVLNELSLAIARLEQEYNEVGIEASYKIRYMVDYLDQQGLLEEHCFTFPDGDTWWATGHEPSPERS